MDAETQVSRSEMWRRAQDAMPPKNGRRDADANAKKNERAQFCTTHICIYLYDHYEYLLYFTFIDNCT